MPRPCPEAIKPNGFSTPPNTRPTSTPTPPGDEWPQALLLLAAPSKNSQLEGADLPSSVPIASGDAHKESTLSADQNQPAPDNNAGLTPEERTALEAYWQRLERLSDAEWQHLYNLILKVLRPLRNHSLLRRLSGTFEEKLNEFITDRIFFGERQKDPARRMSLDHPGFLRTMFRTKLIDDLRQQEGRRKSRARESKDPDRPAYPRRTFSLEELGGSSSADKDAPPPAEERFADEGASNPETAAYHCQLERDEDRFREAARQLYAETAEWVPEVLAEHLCAEGPERKPLSHWRSLLGSSYHYQARKLGITGPKWVPWPDYRETTLGAWLVRVGIDPEDPAEWEVMCHAFKILCEEAFSWQNPAS